MKTLIAVICAVASAIGFNYSAYLWKKSVDRLPPVKFKFQREVLNAFFTNRTWLTGTGFMLGSSVLYGVALSLAKVSVVTPIVASGIALLAYLAIKNLGERPRRIDLIAIGLNVLGVVFIAVSLAEDMSGKSGPETLAFNSAVLWTVAGVALFLAIVAPLAMRATGKNREAAGLGISVGIFYGLNAIFARILLFDWTQGEFLHSLIFVAAWAAVVVPGLVIYQAALQRGMAVIVVPVQAGIAQLIPIAVGMAVLGESFPESNVLTAFRIAGFALILTGTVILAQRSEEPAHGPGPETAVASETASDEATL